MTNNLREQTPILAITSGEPSGIGPDICLRLTDFLQHLSPDERPQLVILADKDLLAERAKTLGIAVKLRDWKAHNSNIATEKNTLDVLHIPLASRCCAGNLDPRNAAYVLTLLDRAIDGCLSGEFAALVTAPVHKGVINLSGIAFTGHTEYLAEKTHTPRVVMMLAGGGLKVALATTHLALKDVPAAITAASLEESLRILHREMRHKYGLVDPRILVAGLNPHAGEDGYLGREEIEIIIPVLNRLRQEKMHLLGPLPADTLFTPRILESGDCVLTMYHDQGLPTLKYASFGNGINVTLGLPLIRTSVDHGTALALAGTGKADPSSLFEAIQQAVLMVSRQQSARH